jgi:predicted nucleotidyltransferase
VGLPDFSQDGLLPPGIHQAHFDDLKARFSFSPRRVEILNNLAEVLRNLPGRAAVKSVLVDGSFVQDKPTPGDVDIVIVVDTGHPEALRVAEWVRDHQKTMKSQKACHVFVADEQLANDAWIKFFGKTRDARAKGLVRLEVLP